MGESFTVQISSNLVRQLVDDGENRKRKTRKPKTKIPLELSKSKVKEHKKTSDTSEKVGGNVASGWPLQPPMFLPVTLPPQTANTELEAIRSVLQESEKVVEKLQKQEGEMLQEVTQRAKDLHDKEFKLPYQKPVPCLAEKDACFECYKENSNNALKCAPLVKRFADCARRVRQQYGG